jgi:AraC-like DNA-binding protein
MSLMRHTDTLREYDPKRGVSVATLAYEYPSGYRVPEHAHGADQLIYAIRGVMQVSSGRSVWLIPPQFALWIPGRTSHWIQMSGPVSMRTLYLRRGLASGLPRGCSVLHVTPLLRELIVETVRVGQLGTRNQHECALCDLLILHLESAPSAPTSVTMPKERRALGVAQAVLTNPAQLRPLAELCGDVGASVRTIERAFRKDVGTTFESWRRQVRLMKAVELLVSGCSIKEAAFGVGYRQSNAFVEMFRQTFGTTPRAWVSGLEKPN